MKNYCVVYFLEGVHYRYRCCASNKAEAKRMCKKHMGVAYANIVEVYTE